MFGVREHSAMAIRPQRFPGTDALNFTFFCGWSYLLFELLRIGYQDPEIKTPLFDQPVSPLLRALAAPFQDEGQGSPLWGYVYGLQLGCWLDVVRMLVGDLNGNIVLGVALHSIRSFCLSVVLPAGPPGDHCHSVSHIVLMTWAISEICRYPYYLHSNDFTKGLRDFAPVITFPIGAIMELCGCVLFLHRENWVIESASQMGAVGVITINIVGGIWSYPPIVAKGIKSLGGVETPGPDKIM